MNQEFENKDINFEQSGYTPPAWLSKSKHPESVSSDNVQDVSYSPVNPTDSVSPNVSVADPVSPVYSAETTQSASPVQPAYTTPPAPHSEFVVPPPAHTMPQAYSAPPPPHHEAMQYHASTMQPTPQPIERPAQPAGYVSSGVPEWSFKRRSEMRPPAQSEPSYREASYRTADNMSNMYTPGLGTNRPYTGSYARRNEDVAPAPPAQPRAPGKAGRFFRALCLVIVCALVSAAATYLVMEYRTEPIVNQVVLGGPGIAATDSGDTRSATMISSSGGMAPEYIYDMALTQVVGIKIEVPTVGIFGTIGSSTAAGSGFIISSDGYILTNFHVIEPAQSHQLPISVIKSDGSEFLAEVVGYEIANDVALLKIDATDLNPVILGNSDDIRVGHTVFAIGNPFGNLVYTMTDGIISALDRDVTVEGIIINTFQFSAAVNRGNSGGPIYNANGEVIGIVTAKMARADVEGIGFAVPINDAIEIATGLIEFGYITGRPMLGITGMTVTRPLAEYYDLTVGVFVRDVNPGSAAERAGLENGDIIVGLGGFEVTSMDTLRFTMRGYRSGETAQLLVWRDGTVIEMSIIFDEDLAAGQPGRSQSIPVEPDESEDGYTIFPVPRP